MNTTDKLNKLTTLKASVGALDAEKKAAIDLILTPELRQKIADIEAEFEPKYLGLNNNIKTLEADIKADVIESGETVKGDFLECTYAKGRVSWDSKGLDTAIKVLPQLDQFRKQGKPYATIRIRK